MKAQLLKSFNFESNMNLGYLIKKCIEKINQSNNIILTTHENPDGDAIGSTLALYQYIRSLGKNVKVINYSPTPPYLEFISYADDILVYEIEQHKEYFMEADLIIVLDLNDIPRMKTVGEAILSSRAYKIIIDHHLEPKEFADLIVVDTDAPATGELIYKLIKSDSAFKMSKGIVDAIYIAILMDTGSFRFDRTDSEVHHIAADLIELGADPVVLYDKVYNIKTLNAVQLQSMSQATTELLFDGKFSIALVRREFFQQTNTQKHDTEGFVEDQLKVLGVEAGVLLTQTTDSSEIRLSFRSKTISIREIAVHFGGGGHAHAAGARIIGKTIDEVKSDVIKEVTKIFS